ncbi:MAG: hypothetical protein IJ710_05665 [Prevotella sp.]|nr:hypothetical protein [Prevotella sp.]
MGIEDANYVDNIGSLHLDSSRIDFIEDCDIQPNLDRLAQIARQSDGTAYENALFDLINQHLTVFRNRQHYGTQATGQRLSDIAFTAPIKNSDGQDANILVIIECKAGNAVRAFDERKERDDIINVVNRYNEQHIDYAGIWYWVADSDALPTEGAHGGSRASNLSKSFAEKLNDLQFTITELSRVPTIVTAFSITALTTYLRYLYQHTNNGHDKVITKLTVPHFWRWSKHFMHLQYITIHHNLNSLNQ